MRVAIYGLGAIGGHMAGRLARGGAQVSVVARGAMLDAVRAAGAIRIEAADGPFTAPIAVASDDPADLGKQDAVIVAVKAPALPSIAPRIAPLLGPTTPVVFAMNGVPWWYFHGLDAARRVPQVDPDGAVWDAIGPARAVGCVVYSACEVTAPGTVHVVNPSSRFILGEPDGRLSDRARAVADALKAGGVASEVTGDIRGAIWAKLLANLATGPIAVLANSTVADTMSEPTVQAAARAVVNEGAAIARALGVAVEVDADRITGNAARLRHRPSILQDLLLGRPMEIDAIYSAPLAMARAAGVATPVLDLLVAMTIVRAREAGLYPRDGVRT
jgi:2-dehydropantoate 2-reductase